jgi:hypothetical protein
MNVATLAYPSPLTSRVCSLDRWAIPLTRLNKVLTAVSYFMVSYFGHSLCNVVSFEWEKMWLCLTVVTVAFKRVISTLILRKTNFLISTKIQRGYLLKRILINNQIDAQFLLCIFISILYMFRATLCSLSGESIVSIQHLVYVTLCRWPSGM